MTTITLKKPITLGGKTINDVSFQREPTLKDMKKFSRGLARGKDELEAMADIVSDLTGLSAAEVDELSIADTASVFGVVEDFFKAFEELKSSKE